jgi:hypothetical protein
MAHGGGKRYAISDCTTTARGVDAGTPDGGLNQVERTKKNRVNQDVCTSSEKNEVKTKRKRLILVSDIPNILKPLVLETDELVRGCPG